MIGLNLYEFSVILLILLPVRNCFSLEKPGQFRYNTLYSNRKKVYMNGQSNKIFI